MTRDEFVSLPAVVALRVLYDCLDEETVKALDAKEKPKLPLPPKYDRSIYRRDGVQWASETDSEGLRFWHKRAADSAAGGGQYAEKDAKHAAALTKWIEWRECFPDAVWSGERGDVQTTARGPSSKPTVYPSQRGGGSSTPKPAPPRDDVDATSDIPF